MIPAYEPTPERNPDIHLYLGSPLSGPSTTGCSGWGPSSPPRASSSKSSWLGGGDGRIRPRDAAPTTGQIFVSELGYGGMSDLVETVAGFGGREDLLDARELKILRDGLLQGFHERNLERIFGSPRGLFDAAQGLQALGNTQQLEAVLTNPRVSGYVLTQLNDVSWEFHAGLLDLWRNPKPSYYAAQRINRPHLLVLRAMRAAVYTGETVELELSLVCRDSLSGVTGLVTIEAVDPAGGEAFRREVEVQLHPGVQVLENISLEGKYLGTYQLAAKLTVDGESLANAGENVLVMERVDWDSLPLKPRLVGKAPASAAPHSAFWTDSSREFTADLGPGLYLAANPSTLVSQQWDTLLAIARSGGVAVCAALRPENHRAIQAFENAGVNLMLHPGIGSWMGCYHWIPDSELFSGLPSGGLAMRAYAEIIPKYVLSEMGGDVQAGSLRNTQSREDSAAMLWYSDIESLRYGSGAIVFCQYRAFENIDRDPLADRLAHNLLRFAAKLT